MAATGGHADCVKLLLDYGANVDAVDEVALVAYHSDSNAIYRKDGLVYMVPLWVVMLILLEYCWIMVLLLKPLMRYSLFQSNCQNLFVSDYTGFSSICSVQEFLCSAVFRQFYC